MKKVSGTEKGSKQRKMAVTLLYLGAAFIVFLGVFFCAYSLINEIYMQVLNVPVSGVVFGLLVVYLGVRYFKNITDQKSEIYKGTETFTLKKIK